MYCSMVYPVKLSIVGEGLDRVILSPLLFVLTADLLQSIVNQAEEKGVLQHPLGPTFGGFYPIVQYADDTLLIMPADAM